MIHHIHKRICDNRSREVPFIELSDIESRHLLSPNWIHVDSMIVQTSENLGTFSHIIQRDFCGQACFEAHFSKEKTP